MKKIILCLALLVSLSPQAQTIHWLTFIDTTDKRVGEIDIVGRKVLYSHFIDIVNATLVQAGYKTDIQDYYGTRLTPENMKAAVQNLRCSSDDIVMFYYIGHGGRALGNDDYIRAHPYPKMCCAQRDPNKYIPLEWVNNTLKSKGARLSVVIGMCCNDESGDIRAKEVPQFGINYGPTYVENSLVKKIQDLFLTNKGNILVTSASPRQLSGCVNSDFGVIDAYTATLIDVFAFYAVQIPEMNWDNILKDIKDVVHKQTGGRQTPIYETHLSKVSAPTSKTTPNKPGGAATPTRPSSPTPSESTSSNDDFFNLVSQYLDFLTNNSNSEEDRINIADRFKRLFSASAKVKFIGQDGEQVIDRESASDFIDRISTSRLIMKVAPVEGTVDNAKNVITELKVREIYKK